LCALDGTMIAVILKCQNNGLVTCLPEKMHYKSHLAVGASHGRLRPSTFKTYSLLPSSKRRQGVSISNFAPKFSKNGFFSPKFCTLGGKFFDRSKFLIVLLLLTGRERLSAYVNCDKYEAATTEPGDDDTHHHHQQQQLLLSTSRLYDRATTASAAGSDVIDQVMQCNDPTPRAD